MTKYVNHSRVCRVAYNPGVGAWGGKKVDQYARPRTPKGKARSLAALARGNRISRP